MPARDPTASPHIPFSSSHHASSSISSSKRAFEAAHVKPNSPAPGDSTFSPPLRPQSPGSSGLSTGHLAFGSVGRRRSSSSNANVEGNIKRRTSLWQSLGVGHDVESGNAQAQHSDLLGPPGERSRSVTIAHSPSQESQTASAIRDRTLNLAASLASKSYTSSKGASHDSDSDSGSERGDENSRVFSGGSGRAPDDRDSCDDTASAIPTLLIDKRQISSTTLSSSSPDSKGGSIGPSGLSVMMKSAAASPTGGGSMHLPPVDGSVRGNPAGVQAIGSNGFASLMNVATSTEEPSSRSPSNRGVEPSPVSSAGTARPLLAGSSGSSASSSVNTVKPGEEPSPLAQIPVGLALNNDRAPAKASETTPLLQTRRSSATALHNAGRNVGKSSTSDVSGFAGKQDSGLEDNATGSHTVERLARWKRASQEGVASLRKASPKDVFQAVIVEPVQCIPAVILGLLLNVLDGVSYGMITFPASPVFTDFGSIGVSMFFVSCIISQLTYTLGGSIFKGGNGSMMIEAVPFFHILTNIIETEIGDDHHAIIATTMVSFAFSAILTGKHNPIVFTWRHLIFALPGLVFLALGSFRLGVLIGYFPRHILVGCIGGVGVFLLETGLEVSRGLKEEGFAYNLDTLRLFIESPQAIALWTIPLALAVVLRLITHKFHHQLIFPAYFFLIPLVFYIVVAIGRWPLNELRQQNWILNPGTQSKPWWTFYTYFDLKQTNWSAFWACIPTQLALVFFGILHVPLNVPALGVSLQEDNVNLDRELFAHGVSNMAAGFLGTVPNYLCYVNTVLFYRVGGGSRLSGLMLAGATAIIMVVGPKVIGFLPVCVVGALIFVLGIDLVKEAIWDTRNRVNRMEYVTIWAIAIGMTIFDFVLGLLLGIVLASLFFVLQNSRRKPIRAVYNGATATSTVRRPHAQRQFIQAVGKQTVVMKLQGFLFFGTITRVEDEIRALLDLAAWRANPIRFLVVDFALVGGLDFSSAEAFVRIQRLLSQKDVLLILCGAKPDGLVGQALRAVDIWADQDGSRIEVFEGLNSALEWCENAYLTAFFTSKAAAREAPRQMDLPTVSRPPFALSESYSSSPRKTHLIEAAGNTLPRSGIVSYEKQTDTGGKMIFRQPLPLMIQTFAGYSKPDKGQDFFYQLVQYFEHKVAERGDILWTQGDDPDGLYLIESGCLKATYQYEDQRELLQETMVAGTVAGELTTLAGSSRNATVVVERDANLWLLTPASMERLHKDKPDVAREFTTLVLKVAAEEADVLSSHLIAVLG